MSCCSWLIFGQTTALRSQTDSDLEDDIGDDAAGISRSRLRINEARSRFLPSNVDATSADFSDRVDIKRKSYKASSRRQRILEDGTEEFGDLSDEDDRESLERKIARLKREVEEVKEEYSKRSSATTGGSTETKDDGINLESLGQALDHISRPSQSSRALPGAKAAAQTSELIDTDALQGPTYAISYAPSFEQTHALAKTTDFDRRLQLLEKSIGVNSTSGLEVGLNGVPRAILPTINTLQNQISTLSQASTSTLDSISRRVRALTQEAEQLARARKDAKDAQDALESRGDRPDSIVLDDQEAKINALYGTLPTIENLAPLLPPLLDRLRSLRALHANAASASETLDRIEKEQAETALEIKQWREGLAKMEVAMKQGESIMLGNMEVMENWVKDLEEKISNLQ
jgi:nuclear migration protein JNM1